MKLWNQDEISTYRGGLYTDVRNPFANIAMIGNACFKTGYGLE